MKNSIIFLSHFFNEITPSYGNRVKFEQKKVSCICSGDTANSASWNFHNHLGTHIDFPRHFYDEGKSLNNYEAKEWCFDSIELINITCKKNTLINVEDIRKEIKTNPEVLLIKTDFEKFRSEKIYWEENPGIAPEVGSWLRENHPQLKIIGFDFISLTAFQHRDIGKLSHKAFLNPAGTNEPIRIIEDMSLNAIDTSPASMIISPLLVENADGTPVTIIAFMDKKLN